MGLKLSEDISKVNGCTQVSLMSCRKKSEVSGKESHTLRTPDILLLVVMQKP